MFELQLTQIGEKVYAGGGSADAADDRHLVLLYDPERDGWEKLPHCPVRRFALGQFQGHLFTIGGRTRDGVTTDKTYHYEKESREWEEYLKPMPTARYSLSTVTTQSAIIACAGVTHSGDNLRTVEVYTAETDQWHTTDPLPFSCAIMTSVVIADSWFLLGGNDNHKSPTKSVLCGSISALVENTILRTQRSVRFRRHSAWTTLPNTALKYANAARLGGCLLAVGGCNDRFLKFPQVHVFLSPTNSWVRMTACDLPIAVDMTSTIQLPDGTLLLCGGRDDNRRMVKHVYIASVVQA